MKFIADKQTLDDLGLLGKFKSNSIYNLFNKVNTAGGERLLAEMFNNPMKDPDHINTRSETFRYFQQKQLSFPFDHQLLGIAENYLSTVSRGGLLVNLFDVCRKKLTGSFLRGAQYKELQEGLVAAIEVLTELESFIHFTDPEVFKKARTILADRRLNLLKQERGKTSFPAGKLARYDHLLRNTMQAEMETLAETIYQLDVYIAVSDVARERGFYYADALPGDTHFFTTTALTHPALNKGVANPLSFTTRENMVFLTGANMAGKSTLMKSFGIAIYLGHMGFPVAAKDMEFSVCDGLYTSINVPDNLNLGYSHFYAEVLRVKTVAEQVASGKKMVVIFDELFKGTNVKDAYDATLACTTAFSKYRNCFFVISTHIIEVGEALNELDNIQFRYLPTVMDGNVPRYTYQLTEGVTSDRQGMIIIENEGILETIEDDKQFNNNNNMRELN